MTQYSISEIRSKSPNAAKFIFELSNVISRDDSNAEEKVILAIWSFDSGMGNGMWDLLANERYDDISSGLSALRAISDPSIKLYLDSIVGFFGECGIDCFNPQSLESGMQRGAPSRNALEHIEAPFIQHIWDGAILKAAVDYVDRNFPNV